MQNSREAFAKLLFQLEGGYVNHPQDHGGPTNHGIAKATLEEWRKHPVTDDDVKNLTLDEAAQIIWLRYWNPIRGNDLVSGIDAYLADFCINSGIRKAVKTLQFLLGFEGKDCDGIVGPLTLQAVAARKPDELLADLHNARMAFLRGLGIWPTFGKGWTDRCNRMLALAGSLLPKEAPAMVARNDGIKRNVMAAVGGVSAAIPVIIAAMPAAKDTYGQVTTALTPLQEIAPWLVPVCGVAAVIAMLYLAVRSSTMAHNAKVTGTAANVVAAPRMAQEAAS